MKKVLAIIIALAVLLSGCSTEGLEAYQNALRETEKIEKCTDIINVEALLEFNTDGLTEEELMDLSYFDKVELSMENKYDSSTDDFKMIGKYYYNFGGLGLDMIIYIDGEEVYMKLPVLDGYYAVDSEKFEEYEEYDNAENMAFYEKVILPITDKWKEILTTEDVVRGEQSYVLTEEGQVKTTTYSISVNEEQLKFLADEMVRVIEEENILEDMIFTEENITIDVNTTTEAFDKEDVISQLKEFVAKVELNSFKGKAYVDFDGRLIKEEFSVVAEFPNSESGELALVELNFSLEKENLGEDQVFDFPDVSIGEIEQLDDFNMEDLQLNEIFN